jgi:carbonic anhydrase
MQDIAKLIAGFRQFQNNYFQGDNELFSQLKKGQQPKTLIIACSDSRVDPSLLTRSEPGDIFVVRNVANLVPPYEPDAHYHGVSSALEYAVCHLQVEHIIVLGHSQCGGIAGLMNSECECDLGEFIGRWITIAAAAKEQVKQLLPEKSIELQTRACEQAAIMLSIDNLLSFPWIQQRVQEKKLFLHGWYFDIQRGELLRYSPEDSCYVALVPEKLIDS